MARQVAEGVGSSYRCTYKWYYIPRLLHPPGSKAMAVLGKGTGVVVGTAGCEEEASAATEAAGCEWLQAWGEWGVGVEGGVEGVIEGAWCGEWGREEGEGDAVMEGGTVKEGEETGAAAEPAPAALRREMAGMAGTEEGVTSAGLRQGGLTMA